MAKKAKIVRLEDLERLAALQCTAAEAAGFFGISSRAFNKLLREDEDVRETWRLYNNTAAIYDKHVNEGPEWMRNTLSRTASTTSTSAL